MVQVRVSLILFLISILFVLDKSQSLCIENCKCYENSKLITCRNLKAFPDIPVHGFFSYLLIFDSELWDYLKLKSWTTLKKISLIQSTYDCHLVKQIQNQNIELESDRDFCSDLTQIRSTTSRFSTILNSTTSNEQFSEVTSLVSTITSKKTDFFTISSIEGEKEIKNFPYVKVIIGVSVFVFLAIVIVIFVIIYYLVKKKVKVSRFRPNLPSGSQLEMGNPSVSIEMDSFDSYDFQSSSENVYEIPNPIYSNV